MHTNCYLMNNYPECEEISHASGALLSFAVGSERAFVCWFPSDYCDTAVGSHSILDEDQIAVDCLFQFTFQSDFSEVHIRNTIGMVHLPRIVDHFMETGGRHPDYSWESD